MVQTKYTNVLFCITTSPVRASSSGNLTAAWVAGSQGHLRSCQASVSLRARKVATDHEPNQLASEHIPYRMHRPDRSTWPCCPPAAATSVACCWPCDLPATHTHTHTRPRFRESPSASGLPTFRADKFYLAPSAACRVSRVACSYTRYERCRLLVNIQQPHAAVYCTTAQSCPAYLRQSAHAATCVAS